MNIKSSELVGLETCCVYFLLLEDIGQCLYHDSQLLLALCFGALKIQETSVCGVETVVDESLHRTFEHLAQDLALARLSLSSAQYSIEQILMYAWNLLHLRVHKVDRCQLL